MTGKSGWIDPVPALGSNVEKPSSAASKDNAVCDSVSVPQKGNAPMRKKEKN